MQGDFTDVIYDEAEFFSDWLRSKELGFFCEFRPPTVMPYYHSHTQIEVNILFSGHIVCLFNNKKKIIKSGEICLFWAVTPHKVEYVSDDAMMGLVYVPINLLLFWPLRQDIISSLMNGSVIMLNNELFITEGEITRWQALHTKDDLIIQQIVSDEIYLMIRRFALSNRLHFSHLAKIFTQHRGISENCKKNIQIILEYIGYNYNKGICIDDISSKVKLHPKYMMSLFQRTLNITVKKYITLLKINHAKRLLLNTDLPIQQVCSESGFKHSSSFYAVFKTYHGESPQKFRCHARQFLSTKK